MSTAPVSRVLLLEDQAIIAFDVIDALASAAFEVTTIRTQAEALDWLQMDRPDAAVLNFRGADGCPEQLAEWLERAGVPWIVYSGGNPHDHEVPAIFRTAVRVLKPAAPDELVAALRTALDGRAAQNIAPFSDAAS